MPASQIRGDYNYQGTVQFTGTVSLPSETVDENDVKATAEFAAANVKHRLPISLTWGATSTPTTGDRAVIVAYKPTRLVAGYVMPITAATSNAAASIDVLKSTGGAYATMLGSTFSASSTQTSKAADAVTVGSTSAVYLAAGNHAIVRVSTSGTAGKLPKGLAIDLRFEEDGQ